MIQIISNKHKYADNQYFSVKMYNNQWCDVTY